MLHVHVSFLFIWNVHLIRQISHGNSYKERSKYTYIVISWFQRAGQTMFERVRTSLRVSNRMIVLKHLGGVVA